MKPDRAGNVEVRHVTFSPSFQGALAQACDRQAEEGFALLRVVHHHAYEAVAVFERLTVLACDDTATIEVSIGGTSTPDGWAKVDGEWVQITSDGVGYGEFDRVTG